MSSGEGVERTFQTYSPLIASIEVKRRGDVRRAKLYYLRDRAGKSARIREKLAAKTAKREQSPAAAAPAPVRAVGQLRPAGRAPGRLAVTPAGPPGDGRLGTGRAGRGQAL